MTELNFRAGDVVFREGDPSSYVCHIEEGSVDILKQVGDREVVLGSVATGEFVGEMGVIEGQPRGATVRAGSDLRLTILSADQFLRQISENSEAAFQTLVRLSERLRAVDERLVKQADTTSAAEGAESGLPAVAEEPAPATEMARATLFAASDALHGVLPDEGLPVLESPFPVGRPSLPDERPPREPLALSIPDARPFRLSRLHFSIVRTDAGLRIRDVGSTLGTQVNDELLGQHAPAFQAPLLRGENMVVAGGRGSPYAFRIVVTEG